MASVVGVAASLRVADLLADGPLSAAELARAANVQEAPLRRILRALASVGVFTELPDGRFAHTDDSRVLESRHPQSVRAWCMLAAGDYQRLFSAISHTVATGEPATQPVLGTTLYEYFDRTPAAADIYDRAMEDLARPLAGLLARGRDWSAVRTIVDVGGGRGTIVRGLLRAVPHLRGISFDRPGVCARAATDVEPEIRERLSYEAGDFFVSLPAGADLYILKNVVHNWDDASAVALMAPIAEAMRGTTAARLWIIESLREGGMTKGYKALDDLVQLVIGEAGAQPRNVAELTALAGRAGLRVVVSDALPSGHTLIEAVLAEA